MYEEIESLRNFWKRYNKVLLDVIAIKKQKTEVERQNEMLRSMLQQYYDGLTVNNVVMTNENPLLMIDNKNTINYVLESKKPSVGVLTNGTLQEASHMIMEYNRQYNY
jgi:hypothetical protein